MKTSDTQAFVNQLLICFLVTICAGGSIGLGTVWMRNQISVVANANRALAAQIVDVERRVAATKSLVDVEQSQEMLRQRNAEWHLGLVLVSDSQVISVSEDPTRALVARGNRGLFNDRPASVSFRVALGQ